MSTPLAGLHTATARLEHTVTIELTVPPLPRVLRCDGPCVLEPNVHTASRLEPLSPLPLILVSVTEELAKTRHVMRFVEVSDVDCLVREQLNANPPREAKSMM